MLSSSITPWGALRLWYQVTQLPPILAKQNHLTRYSIILHVFTKCQTSSLFLSSNFISPPPAHQLHRSPALTGPDSRSRRLIIILDRRIDIVMNSRIRILICAREGDKRTWCPRSTAGNRHLSTGNVELGSVQLVR